MEKFYSSKALLKMAGEGMHLPISPLDPPLPEGWLRIFASDVKEGVNMLLHWMLVECTIF